MIQICSCCVVKGIIIIRVVCTDAECGGVLALFFTCVLVCGLHNSLVWSGVCLSGCYLNQCYCAFHYYKATKTSPGHPPTVKSDIRFVSVCKKCIIPKPARTHHCGICNRCILKMDHHCPWLNNCVGHFNHRYFFSFCLFMTLGCAYCSISGRNLFLDAYNTLERIKHLDMEKPGVPVTGIGALIGLLPSGQTKYQTPAPSYTFMDKMFNKCVIFMWVLTSTVGVTLGALTCWHAVLISRGETSIEKHINSKERERHAQRGQIYRNPFNYGRLNNWKIFLGVERKSHWLTRVLLPSEHYPYSDGLTWEIYTCKKDLIPV
uniref:Palmitoyltransferase n=1 Tax=Knipowitschia caucasica TaxID=637954 RepID=A0AAV2JRZ4_KNICA